MLFPIIYDYIYTSNGTPIEVIYRVEMSADEITEINNDFKSNFPKATFLGNSSRTYNCHSYAWNMTLGGPACWINSERQNSNEKDGNLRFFWDDKSFLKTRKVWATRIHYYKSDHSAIVKNGDNTKFISKWGTAPLMEHAPGYGPYDNMDSYNNYAHKDDFIPQILMPDYGTYLMNHEYEFHPFEHIDDINNYICVWTIYEDRDDGKDAVELGKATFNIENDELPHIAKISFLMSGLYTISLDLYTGDDEFVNRYTCQAYVE